MAEAHPLAHMHNASYNQLSLTGWPDDNNEEKKTNSHNKMRNTRTTDNADGLKTQQFRKKRSIAIEL